MMVQKQSRPDRWRKLVDLAANAAGELGQLHVQWAIKLEELREELANIRAERSRLVEEYNDAISRLEDLQSEYESWSHNMPDSFDESRVTDKLDDVQNFDFKFLKIEELKKFVLEQAMDELPDEDDLPDEREDPYLEHAVDRLDEAKKLKLPKGYGRD
jgi:sRNA-binding protein